MSTGDIVKDIYEAISRMKTVGPEPDTIHYLPKSDEDLERVVAECKRLGLHVRVEPNPTLP